MKNSLVAIWYGRSLTIRWSWYQVRAEPGNDWSTASETIGIDFVKHETPYSAHTCPNNSSSKAMKRLPINRVRKVASDEKFVPKVRAWNLKRAGGSLLESSRKRLNNVKLMTQQQWLITVSHI